MAIGLSLTREGFVVSDGWFYTEREAVAWMDWAESEAAAPIPSPDTLEKP